MAVEPITSVTAMRLKRLASLVSLMTLFGSLGPSSAQSLADAAKKAEERRKARPAPKKVYTNKDLPGADVAPPPDAKDADAAKSTEAAKPATDAKDPKDAKDKDAKDKDAPVKDQAYWAGRKKVLQDQLERDQTYAEALQSRVNALSTDFVNRDDPAQRGAIARDRQKATAELTRLKQQILDDKKALADLDEEARRAGVPPGWLR
jgi:hypothetical protein